jgi:squalene-associated FAD-dependent desaturase
MTATRLRRVVVVGGGLAGIAAAVHCADAGAQVTLFEAKPRLGGLTHSFRRGELWVDNGQHVFLRCCTAYRGLLDRLGVGHLVTLQSRLDIPVYGPHRVAHLRGGALPAPLHLAGSLARYPWLSVSQRLSCARAALALRTVRPEDPRTDRISFGSWLRAHGQGRRAIEVLWDLVGIATLNAHADDVSLALAATVFRQGLLEASDAGDVGWSTVPLQRLHGQAATETLDAGGADIVLRTKVDRLEQRHGGWNVSAGGTLHQCDAVVLATPAPVAERLLPAGAVPLPAGWSHRLGSSPILNLHLVLDRRVLDEPFVAAVDSPIQWVFDRTGQAGLGAGQYLAVSMSAADALIDAPTAELRQRLVPELQALLPTMRKAQMLDFFVTRERAATFKPAPGVAVLRPPCRTEMAGLYVAGAWTSTGWPATMEGAVRSGVVAAEAALREGHHAPTREMAA